MNQISTDSIPKEHKRTYQSLSQIKKSFLGCGYVHAGLELLGWDYRHRLPCLAKTAVLIGAWKVWICKN
jgi:hypothetical protein